MLASFLSFPARAECVTSDPIPSALAENVQIYAEICNLGWSGGHSILPCPITDPGPILETGSERSQGATVNTTIPSFANGAEAIWWEAADSGYNRLWIDRSVQGKPTNGYPSGAVVSYGLTALRPNATNYVRSAIEYSNNKKSCWSQWTTIQTTAFSPSGPGVPSGMYVKFEDEFDRPATDPAHATPGKAIGDGLGPSVVWWTSDYLNAAQTAQIASNSTEAKMVVSSSFRYAAAVETNQKTFAQIKLRVDLSGGSAFAYNFQTQARIGVPDPQTGVQKSYAAKLVKGARGCSNPTIILFRLPDEYGEAKCELSGGQEVIDPDVGGAFCTNSPPLDVPDPDRPGYSKPVWMRIEVENDLVSGDPIIRGQAYWYDSSGNLQTCTATMPQRVDAGDPGGMVDVRGQWGAGFHEKTYVPDEIIGGDGTAP